MKNLYSIFIAASCIILTIFSNVNSQNSCIGDFVWEDLNQNGYQEMGEGGLVTTITLYTYETNELIATTTSDANGFYTLCHPTTWDIFRLHFAPIPGYSRSPLIKACEGCFIDSHNKTDIDGNVYIVFLSNNDELDAGYYMTALPVHLKELAIKKDAQNKTTYLNWETSTESNNKGWEIQRTYESNQWETIGWVAGSGNSSAGKYYYFTDPRPKKGLNLYRLKQLDLDGKVSYSEIKQIELLSDEITVYPNPVSDMIYAKGLSENSHFTLSRIDGVIVLKGVLTDGFINVSELLPASYMLELTTEGQINHHRVIKVR